MRIWAIGAAAVLLGAIIGGIVNMTIVIQGAALVPLPEGVDPADPESLAANMHRFGPAHFLAPWFAHAAGSFVGALVAGLIAVRHRMRFALGIAAFTMLGGIANAYMLPAPVWFVAADLLGAYLPMGWLAGHLALRLRPEPGAEPVTVPGP
jgi:hypothetical protein